MAEPGLQGDVQFQVVMEESQKLYHEVSESFLCVFLFEGEPGSWSRGYDVALTWRRSQVQFLPSPPIELILFNLFIKFVRNSQSALSLVLLRDEIHTGYHSRVRSMCSSTGTQIDIFNFDNSEVCD